MYKLCVLMSTYNGEEFLREQIDSVLEQIDVDAKLLIRDDGSCDRTCEIIEEYAEIYPNKVMICCAEKGANLGYNKSFFLLLKYANEVLENEFDFLAFSDQDDVWKEDKLVKACEKMDGLDDEAVYFSQKIIVDSVLKPIGEDLCNYHGVFEDFYDRSNASGCTMVINRKYIDTLADQELLECPYTYDSYIYRSAIVCGYHICYDSESFIYYRQHGGNAIGAWKKEERWYQKFKKYNVIFAPKEHFYQKCAAYILEHNKKGASENNAEKVKLLLDYDGNFIHKINLMWSYWLQSKSDLNRKLIIEMRMLFNII